MTVFDAIWQKSGSFRSFMLREMLENIGPDGKGFSCWDEFVSFRELGVNLLENCSGDCVRCMKNLLMMDVGEFNGSNFRF